VRSSFRRPHVLRPHHRWHGHSQQQR
jgi:hypothetical protein